MPIPWLGTIKWHACHGVTITSHQKVYKCMYYVCQIFLMALQQALVDVYITWFYVRVCVCGGGVPALIMCAAIAVIQVHNIFRS
jgi:hypothetical protein